MLTLGHPEFLVGLGSNSADAAAMLRRARSALRAHPRLELVGVSPIYSSSALLPPGAPQDWDRPYLNAACRMRLRDATQALGPPDAHALLQILKQIERELGREQAERWAPRAIDLDLLAWGGEPVDLPEIQIPHRELQARPFALLPALDCTDGTHSWRNCDPSDVPQRTQRAGIAWPELVGILNLTPDSFSDGSPHLTELEIESRVRTLVVHATTHIDFGAESTRPGATPLTSAQEIARIAPFAPLLSRLKAELGLTLSLDSRHTETIAWCLKQMDLDWINDVTGLRDPALCALAAKSQCSVVVMHSLEVPPIAGHTLAVDVDPIEQLLSWGHARIEALESQGIARERIIFDPGIGFGKTPEQNAQIVRRARAWSKLPVRTLIGHSRKRFLDPQNTVPASARDLETAILTAGLANSGVDYLRIHAAETQARALSMGARLL